MHEVVVRSPIRYMGACTSVHARNQSRAVHWNHAPKSFMQQTNHGALHAGWKPKVQPNKTPCIIVSWLRWACTTPPSRTKTSWATNHPLLDLRRTYDIYVTPSILVAAGQFDLDKIRKELNATSRDTGKLKMVRSHWCLRRFRSIELKSSYFTLDARSYALVCWLLFKKKFAIFSTLSPWHHIKYTKRHMFGAVNVGKKITNYTVLMYFATQIFWA
jgi:hypothetical protein